MVQPEKGLRGIQPPLAKLFRRFNPKIQSFKSVLDLKKGLGVLILLMTYEFYQFNVIIHVA